VQGQLGREARLPEGRHSGHPEAQVSRRGHDSFFSTGILTYAWQSGLQDGIYSYQKHFFKKFAQGGERARGLLI
jgi:hypothetical protein